MPTIEERDLRELANEVQAFSSWLSSTGLARPGQSALKEARRIIEELRQRPAPPSTP